MATSQFTAITATSQTLGLLDMLKNSGDVGVTWGGIKRKFMQLNGRTTAPRDYGDSFLKGGKMSTGASRPGFLPTYCTRREDGTYVLNDYGRKVCGVGNDDVTI